MSQEVLTGNNAFSCIAKAFKEQSIKKVLVVCGPFYDQIKTATDVKSLGAEVVKFLDFTPNPTIEQVKEGIKVFRRNDCDAIIAVGGGSAIDVAKCIKLYCKEDLNSDILQCEHKDSGVLLIAIPTTAGTGSESTRFAVVYAGGVKQSVTDEIIIPNFAVLDGALLKGLPLYQKKCTLLDAFCQAIESFWSINSTDESKAYSKEAIKRILENCDEYLKENAQTFDEIMLGANFAGKAINITQTTAAHAMSYKITSLYGLPHGHSVAICLPVLWEYMINHIDDCIDKRGVEYLKETFNELAMLLNSVNPSKAIEKIKLGLKDMDIFAPTISEEELNELANSVNTTRLKNNPISLDETALKELYKKVSKI